MRLIAKVPGHGKIKRLMIHGGKDGIFLFTFEIEEDGACSSDSWFENIEDAMEVANEEYGVSPEDWRAIPDPPPYCQQDWIAPARIPGRESGNPQWGKLEVLIDGKWVQKP